MTISAGGNVGIGTTAPVSLLSVSLASGSTSTLPTIGTAGGIFGVYSDAQNYGTMFGSLSTGNGFIQQQRTDDGVTAYDLLLNPNGGDVGIGTTTPTQPFSVKEKSGMTAIGGFAIKLTNKTGGNSAAGRLVTASTGNNDAVTYVGANGLVCIGVFLDSGIADGSEAWVVVSGIADVAMETNTATTRGYWVKVSDTEAGYADATNAFPPGGTIVALEDHNSEIGHCIESVAAGGAGTHILARCVLHFN